MKPSQISLTNCLTDFSEKMIKKYFDLLSMPARSHRHQNQLKNHLSKSILNQYKIEKKNVILFFWLADSQFIHFWVCNKDQHIHLDIVVVPTKYCLNNQECKYTSPDHAWTCDQ